MEWDPCGDDFGYAEKWSKQFIDANDFTEKFKTKSCLERANHGQGCTSRRTSRQIPKTTLFRKLARIQMSLKNNDVGRQVNHRKKRFFGFKKNCATKKLKSDPLTLIRESWKKNPKRGTITERVLRKKSRAQH